jgi:hypothetical protein
MKLIRPISLVLLCIAFVPSWALGDPLTYNVVGDTVTIKDCKETASGALAIPPTYDGKPVTSIGGWVFSGCSSLTSVTIPDSVTSIGYGAFSGCSSLTSVTIPDSVTSIGESAFWGCSSLTSVTIGDSVTSIGKYAFRYCKSLTGVTIPDSVTSIGESAFWGCSSLTSIEVGKGNSEYSSEDGVLFDKYETVLIQFPAGKSGHYTIPDSVTIGKSAFKNCSSLTSVTIPDSFTSIWSWAFSGCSSLTSVTIPDSVTSIGGNAFRGCSSLTSVTIPESVTRIVDWAFDGCSSLTNIYFESNAPSIRCCVFREVSKNAKIFVNPSATGFGKTFAGLPVQILEKTLKINTFSKSASPFSLTFETQSDSTYKIEASHDLKKWGEIGEVQGTGSSVEFTDWREALFQKQYYRLRLVE